VFSVHQWPQWFQRRSVAVKIVGVLDETWLGMELKHRSIEDNGPTEGKKVVIVSLTHLRVGRQHPLVQEIRTYQRERTRRIAQSGGPREPSHFTVRPRKRRRR